MGLFADQLLITLRSEWSIGSDSNTQTVPAGSLLAASVDDVLANGSNAKFTILFTPSARVSSLTVWPGLSLYISANPVYFPTSHSMSLSVYIWSPSPAIISKISVILHDANPLL